MILTSNVLCILGNTIKWDYKRNMIYTAIRYVMEFLNCSLPDTVFCFSLSYFLLVFVARNYWKCTYFISKLWTGSVILNVFQKYCLWSFLGIYIPLHFIIHSVFFPFFPCLLPSNCPPLSSARSSFSFCIWRVASAASFKITMLLRYF